jgi:hypothetical protein
MGQQESEMVRRELEPMKHSRLRVLASTAGAARGTLTQLPEALIKSGVSNYMPFVLGSGLLQHIGIGN